MEFKDNNSCTESQGMSTTAPKCRTTELRNSTIETTLISILHGVSSGQSIAEVVPFDELLIIVHRATELLQKEPMLLEIEFSSGVIVGDLHGSFIDLLSVINEAGSPPEKKYLFLGDYVDRGKHQVETLLFILLLKLRWRSHVFMLRGNHEIYDTNIPANGFLHVCRQEYGNDYVYAMFSRLFDVISVAAILNGDTLCCHGGISQWMTSREAIRNITKPVNMRRMKLLEDCLLCDILWADYADTVRPFTPSVRGGSYTYNKTAIEIILSAINCRRLIRAHQPFFGGAVVNCKNLCYTVHTVPIFKREYHGAYIWTKIGRDGAVEYRLRPHSLFFISKPQQIESFVQPAFDMLMSSFRRDSEVIYDYAEINPFCALCIFETLSLRNKGRLISHKELAEWVNDNAQGIVTTHHLFSEICRMNEFDLRQIAICFTTLFPVAFDIVNLDGCTYRRGLPQDEKDFILKWHPGGSLLCVSIHSSRIIFELETRNIVGEGEPYKDSDAAPAPQYSEVTSEYKDAPLLTIVDLKDTKKHSAMAEEVVCAEFTFFPIRSGRLAYDHLPHQPACLCFRTLFPSRPT